MKKLSRKRKLDEESSSSSESSDSEVEILDPSDPRAHVRASNAQSSKSIIDLTDEVPNSPTTIESVVQDDILISNDVTRTRKTTQNNDIQEKSKDSNKKIVLSKWASRFLTPRKNPPNLVEPPIEPIQDFILSDFSTRYRGDHVTEKENKAKEKEKTSDASDSESSSNDHEESHSVGAPILLSPEPSPPSSSSKTKLKPQESRYFRKDITTKCFNCNEIGHMSGDCVNERVLKPCYYCGDKKHIAATCSNMRCFLCYLPGHISQMCPNKNIMTSFCKICGSSKHEQRKCNVREDRFNDVTCMICWKKGHVCCLKLPRPINRYVYCPFCSDDHPYTSCSRIKDHSSRQGRRFRTSDRNHVSATCFHCERPGHIAINCPFKKKKQQKNLSKKRKLDISPHDELPTRRRRCK